MQALSAISALWRGPKQSTRCSRENLRGSTRSRTKSAGQLGCLLGLAMLAGSLLNGCAALTNPVADGVPVRRLPQEILGPSKDELQQIPLSSLRQKRPEVYRLGAGDVLGIWVEGVLGERGAAPPVQIPNERSNLPPALGFPFPIREDGTVPLPLVKPIKVAGLSLTEAQDAIIKAYTVDKKILQPDQARVVVTLIRPRQFRVLVLREDAGGSTFSTSGGFGGFLGGGGSSISQTRRVAGFPLDLDAYENDVLTALTRTGGLPGFDAENEVIIERGGFQEGSRVTATEKAKRLAQSIPDDARGGNGNIIRIPIRLYPWEKQSLPEEDIILRSGDIVYVRARRGDFFYTAGLLPARAFPLPADRDLDVLQALSLIGAPLVNGGFNTNNFVGVLVQMGIGFPSPSLVTVLRPTENGRQIPIRVDINRALRDPRERLLIQPGDTVVLQETVGETLGRYFITNARFNLFGFFVRRRDLTGTVDFDFP